MIARLHEALEQGRIAARHNPAVANRVQILQWMQTKARRVAPAANALPVKLCADGLGGVLQDKQVLSLGNRQDFAHPRWPSGQMDWNNRFRPRRDGGFEPG